MRHKLGWRKKCFGQISSFQKEPFCFKNVIIAFAPTPARLVCGLNGVYTPSEIRKALKVSSIQDCLNYVKVKKGDFVYIPAGTVHAIGGGLRLLEVQQSCDITYRFFDWGRGRECQEEKAIACIKDSPVRSVGPFPGVFSCPYFTLEQIFVEGEYEGGEEIKATGDFSMMKIVPQKNKKH